MSTEMKEAKKPNYSKTTEKTAEITDKYCYKKFK